MPNDVNLPPPPPPEADEVPGHHPFTSVTSLIELLTGRINSLESRLEEYIQGVSDCVPYAELESKCKISEERTNYRMARECDRTKKQLELTIQDLGQSMIDCLKRRDFQIDQKLRSLVPSMSTPVHHAPGPSVPHSVPKQRDQTYSIQYSHLPISESQLTMQHNPPVKLDFPNFSNSQEEDPVVFIERCEEYFAIRPLSEGEIMASLTAVLKGTAKDWWLAERRNVQNWKQFKETFLLSFLSEDYEEVAARKLLERKQGVKESIRDFAFQYRALCLRWKSEMPEKEVVQAILRNCNPRLASLLRGTVKEVGELVRIGTQIERDFDESKRYWSQVNVEEQKRKPQSSQDLQRKPPHANTRVVQSHNTAVQSDLKTITIPILLQDRYFKAMVDTGSTLSLIQKSFWKQLCKEEQFQSSNGQSFLLANGQRQTAIGKVEWRCEIQGQPVKLTLFILNDADLTVPIILGMDFLLTSGIKLDFQKVQYSLPSKENTEENTYPFLTNECHSTVNFYLALPTPTISEETLHSIRQLRQQADTSERFKGQLEDLMLEWPSVCTHEIGQSSLVKHCIITTNQVPVRKRAYKVSTDKQRFIDSEVKDLLAKEIIQPSISPWASPVVVVPKKDGSSRFCVDYRGLNAKTYLDAYPMPQIQDILESLHGATVFSTLDLKSGYWQVEMEKDSIQKTAFVTSAGLYEFLRLPFGLKNVAASFQRLMEHVLRELRGKCCLIYIDDVVVFSQNEKEHLQHLSQVFHCFHDAGLTLNLKKCNLIQRSLSFLGHIVSGEGIKTDPSKIAAVNSFPTPQSLKEVQRFFRVSRMVPSFYTTFL